MKLDLSKFIAGLQKYLKEAEVDELKEKLFELFDLIFTDVPVNQIDFSSFTSQHVLEAVYEIYNCRVMENGDEEPETLFDKYFETFELAESFLRAKPINIETEEDDFI